MTRLDHRPIVAAQRREKMMTRLVEAGLLVFAEKGFDAVVIEDIITAAGVSRGSFYNHFSDVNEVMRAALDVLVEELLDMALSAVATVTDPAEASALALRAALTLTEDYPLLARFSARIGVDLAQRGNLMSVLIPPLLEEGMATGRFCRIPHDLAVDMVSAQAVVAFNLQAAGIAFDKAEIIAAVLRLLGLPAAEATALSQVDCQKLRPAPSGLIARSEAARQRRLPVPDRVA